MNGPIIAQVIFWTVIVLVVLVVLGVLCISIPEIGFLIVFMAFLYLFVYIVNLLYQWAFYGDVYFTEFWRMDGYGTPR